MLSQTAVARLHHSTFARIVLAILCTVLAAQTVTAQPVSKEYQLKAAFLYNFTKFVEWPPDRLGDPAAPIVIAVVGGNPFGMELQNAVHGRKVRGRPLEIRLLQSATEAKEAHVVFLHGATPSRETLAELHRSGVLTVGENDAFAAGGGHVTFTLHGGKLRFAINQTAAERAQLKMSAQLLKLAAAVN